MLLEKFQEDLKAAMIAHDEQKLSVIRMLKSAIQYFEIQKGGAGYSAKDEEILDVISKEVKKRREAIDLYEKGGRPELAEKEKQEMKILQSYLPEQMSEDEVRKLVSEAIEQTGANSIQEMGKVMGVLMPKVKGKADSSLVSDFVRERLNQS